MWTIKVKDELLCVTNLTEYRMVIRGNSNTDKKFQIFHSNSEGFRTWLKYNSQTEVFSLTCFRVCSPYLAPLAVNEVQCSVL
jgi:hypothetical protein